MGLHCRVLGRYLARTSKVFLLKQPPNVQNKGFYGQACSRIGFGEMIFQENRFSLRSISSISQSIISSSRDSGRREKSHVVSGDLSDASLVFQALQALNVGGNNNMARQEREDLLDILHRFENSGMTQNQALGIYVGSSLFKPACAGFRTFFLQRCTRLMRQRLFKLDAFSGGAHDFLFSLFAEYCRYKHGSEINQYRSLARSTDLTKPHTWYPFARASKRKVVYHCGPTNSGKTYTALQRLIEAPSGIYCGPLRLLALEVYEKVNLEGTYCSLLTGQEKRQVPFATHLSCTVETAPLHQSWDVAVIDEIQMINDNYRGYAWTRALLGLQASEIHLCGDPSSLTLIKSICAATGDVLEEAFYRRFEPISVDCKSLNGEVKNVQAGDCIVAFSRRDIFSVKKYVEQHTAYRCCVVYGSLPPETRSEQAKLFNDPDSGFDVLVASDAIGMGLNLNIRRVVFYTLEKFNGDGRVLVPASSVKQIAGRAGRRGSLFPQGIVTTFHRADIDYLIACMKAPFQDATRAGLFPAYQQFELFASQFPSVITLSKLLDMFSERCRLDGSYSLCRWDNVQKVAKHLELVQGLSLEEMFQLCFSPVQVHDPKCMEALLGFAKAYSKKEAVPLLVELPLGYATTDTELLDFERRHKILSIYLWLSYHLQGEYFVHREEAEELMRKIALLLGESLALKFHFKP